MFNGKYTHLNEILERVRRDYGFQDVYADEAAEWIWDCLGYFGRDEILENSYANVKIENNRGLLPPDLYKLTGCRTSGGGQLLPTSDRYFDKNIIPSNSFGEAIIQGKSINLTSSKVGDNVVNELNPSIILTEFISGPASGPASGGANSMTYQINGGYIFCGILNTTLEIAYKAFPMWEDYTPKIPDDVKIVRMVVLHIAERIAMRLWISNKLSKQILEDIRTDLDFAVGAAHARVVMPDEDMMESIKRQQMRLIPKPNEWSNGFRNHNAGESIKNM